MPIKIKVEKYCYNCPNFDPVVDKEKSYRGEPGEPQFEIVCNTIIYCEYEEECAVKMKYLKRYYKNQETIKKFTGEQ